MNASNAPTKTFQRHSAFIECNLNHSGTNGRYFFLVERKKTKIEINRSLAKEPFRFVAINFLLIVWPNNWLVALVTLTPVM